MAWLVRAMERDETIKRKPGEPEEIILQRLMPRRRAAHPRPPQRLQRARRAGAGHRHRHAARPHAARACASTAASRTASSPSAWSATSSSSTIPRARTSAPPVAALTGLGADRAPAKLVVILGGDGKGQDFEPLAEPLRRHARAAATIGQDAPRIEAVVQSAGVQFQRHATLEEATRWCHAQAQAGDAVLLSPACASFDMFRNYAHRAEVVRGGDAHTGGRAGRGCVSFRRRHPPAHPRVAGLPAAGVAAPSPQRGRRRGARADPRLDRHGAGRRASPASTARSCGSPSRCSRSAS
jgi:UDP-N-acetylmuramoylalanine--D-glutamate ligase